MWSLSLYMIRSHPRKLLLEFNSNGTHHRVLYDLSTLWRIGRSRLTRRHPFTSLKALERETLEGWVSSSHQAHPRRKHHPIPLIWRVIKAPRIVRSKCNLR